MGAEFAAELEAETGTNATVLNFTLNIEKTKREILLRR